MRLGTINHPEPIIDRKVKYFYDHLRYLASLNRDLASYPLENHLHLLERIQYKLSSPVLHPSSIRVIEKYFKSNPLFHLKSDFFSRKEKIRKLLLILNEANSKNSIDEKFKSAFSSLVIELNGKNKFNGDKYFLSVLNELTKCLNSRKTIKDEKDKIEYFSNLLFSEFLRVGFHQDDIAGFRGIMERILSKRIEIHDRIESDLYSEFPLPPDIESKRNEKGFKTIVDIFLNNRTFDQQFKGFYNQFITKKDAHFLFKIFNVSNESLDFHFKHNGVEIFHQSQLNVNMSTWEEDYIDKFKEFTEEKNTILVRIKLSYRSQKLAVQSAMLRIREAIDFLNFVSKDKKKNFNGAILGTSQHYIIYEEGKSIRGIWQNDKINSINSSIQQVKNYLYPKGFETLPPHIKKAFLQNDKILFRASTTNYWDEKVNCYWRFLDGIFGYGIDNNSSRDLIKKVSKILLSTEEEIVKVRRRYTITNALHNSDSKMINVNIPPAHLSESIDKSVYDEKEFLKLEKIADYPFINERFEDYKKNEINYSKAHDFYTTLLWEAFEQRNFAFHQNDFCFSTVEKLAKNLPNAINRIRETILAELILNNKLTIQDAIKQLSQKGYTLLSQN